MASEFESGAEPKDRTKYMWGVVILVFVLMVVALSFQGRVKPNTSVVRLKHILIQFSGSDPADESRAREVVRGLRERILNGEDFGKLAAEFSNDPQSATRGGDIGPTEKGTLAEQMEQFAWTAPIGQLSDVIRTSYGYHLAIVTERFISDTDRLKMEQDQQWLNRDSGQDSAPAPAPAAPSP